MKNCNNYIHTVNSCHNSMKNLHYSEQEHYILNGIVKVVYVNVLSELELWWKNGRMDIYEFIHL